MGTSNISKNVDATMGRFTLYLCLADAFAISDGIWTITSTTRSGIEIMGILPIEEALFFALTNLFVLQGLCLWETWRNKG